MRLEYKLVIGVAIFGGLVSSIVIYVGGLFSPPPVVVEEPTATLPPPKVSTVLPPTSTPIPTPTEEPILRARLSHYWPAWGPPSCHPENWVNGKCLSRLSDGRVMEHWTYWTDIGIACPIQFDIGTQIYIDGFGTGIWTCVDRGGAIEQLPDGTFFLDLLTKDQPWVAPDEAETIYDPHSPHGSYVVKVKVVK